MMFNSSPTPLPNDQQSAPRRVRVCVFAVRFDKFCRRLTSIKPAQKQRRRCLKNLPRRVSQ
jgi:hypothetical protein